MKKIGDLQAKFGMETKSLMRFFSVGRLSLANFRFLDLFDEDKVGFKHNLPAR